MSDLYAKSLDELSNLLNDEKTFSAYLTEMLNNETNKNAGIRNEIFTNIVSLIDTSKTHMSALKDLRNSYEAFLDDIKNVDFENIQANVKLDSCNEISQALNLEKQSIDTGCENLIKDLQYKIINVDDFIKKFRNLRTKPEDILIHDLTISKPPWNISSYGINTSWENSSNIISNDLSFEEARAHAYYAARIGKLESDYLMPFQKAVLEKNEEMRLCVLQPDVALAKSLKSCKNFTSVTFDVKEDIQFTYGKIPIDLEPDSAN